MISTVRILRSLLHGFVTERDQEFGMPDRRHDGTFALLMAKVEGLVG